MPHTWLPWGRRRGGTPVADSCVARCPRSARESRRRCWPRTSASVRGDGWSWRKYQYGQEEGHSSAGTFSQVRATRCLLQESSSSKCGECNCARSVIQAQEPLSLSRCQNEARHFPVFSLHQCDSPFDRVFTSARGADSIVFS